MRGRTRLDREARRRQLLDAAVAVLDGRDAAKVTFEEIADAAGVSRALVYDYFGDRQGLLDAVYEQAYERLRARVDAAVVTARSVRSAVDAIVCAHLELARDDLHAYRLACAAGTPPAPSEAWVRPTAEALGGTPASRLAAVGSVAALQAMVLAWASEPEVPFDQAHHTITAIVYSGVSGVGDLGCTVRPWWPRSPADSVDIGA